MQPQQARECAQRLVATHEMGSWSVDTLSIWLECDCRCVYCNRFLLEDRDTAYFFHHLDHLLPQSKYPQLAFASSNLVLACKSCNTIKREWDPNGDGQLTIGTGGNTLEHNERQKFIAATKSWLDRLREENKVQFNKEKELIESCLRNDRFVDILKLED